MTVAEAPPPAGVDVLTLGESLGLIVPDRSGPLRDAMPARYAFGGAESNVAIGVSRLGGRAAWAGRVGADSIGTMITRELRAERVATHATVDPDRPTALMLKEWTRPGFSRITYYRAGFAGSALSADDVPVDQIAAAAVLHVTGITLGLGGGPTGAVHTAVAAARAAGRLVSFDVNHRASLWSDPQQAADAYRQIARRADVIFAGQDEAELLTGQRGLDAQLDALLEFGANHVVIKRAEHGAAWAGASGERLNLPAVPVAVVDTVGAGDAFVAGWLTDLCSGAGAEDRMRTAVACGALACTVQGDWEAAPTRADLDALTSGGAGDPVSR